MLDTKSWRLTPVFINPKLETQNAAGQPISEAGNQFVREMWAQREKKEEARLRESAREEREKR